MAGDRDEHLGFVVTGVVILVAVLMGLFVFLSQPVDDLDQLLEDVDEPMGAAARVQDD